MFTQKHLMKRTVSLPAMVAHAAQASSVSYPADDPRSIHAPLFTTIFVLTPLLWPVGIVMGIVYLCNARWRAAGAAMLSLGLIAALISTTVYWSMR
jgi:TRAP-type C4-dicarboxylate transport system permease large subunit